MQVRIITHCPEAGALYGNLMVFRTLRIGFPTARVVVTDNDSRPWARVRIAEAVQRCGAELRVAGPMTHHELIAKLVSELPAGEPAALVDPDVWFWESVENWSFPSEVLVAGRLIPAFRCEVTQSVTQPRLHTSFLWMQDQDRLRQAWPGLTKPTTWQPFERNVGVEKHRWDTGARLYAELEPQSVAAFDEAHLHGYDHLFCGTNAATVLPRIGGDFRPQFEQLHAAAREGGPSLPDRLRGAWKLQDRYFAARRVSAAEHCALNAPR